jgi:hypothetical protein
MEVSNRNKPKRRVLFSPRPEHLRTELILGVLHCDSRVKVGFGGFGDDGVQVRKRLACQKSSK